MRQTGIRSFHHSDPIIGIGQEQIDFEIMAQKRYDEKRKPVKKNKDGRRRNAPGIPLRIKSKSRISKFQ